MLAKRIITVVGMLGFGCATARWPPPPDHPESSNNLASSLRGRTVTVELRPQSVAGDTVVLDTGEVLEGIVISKPGTTPLVIRVGRSGEVRSVATSAVKRVALRDPASAPDAPQPHVLPLPESLDLHLDDIDSVALRGRTTNVSAELSLAQVQSISHTSRAGTAILGALFGAGAGGLIAYAVVHSGSNCQVSDKPTECSFGPLAGAAAGLIVGAIVGALIGYEEKLLIEPASPRTRRAEALPDPR